MPTDVPPDPVGPSGHTGESDAVGTTEPGGASRSTRARPAGSTDRSRDRSAEPSADASADTSADPTIDEPERPARGDQASTGPVLAAPIPLLEPGEPEPTTSAPPVDALPDEVAAEPPGDPDSGPQVDDRGFLDRLEPDPFDELPPREHRVTAVLVAHDGERWLPATLTALARLARRPDRLVAVDTGSTDGTAALLERARAAGVVDRVVTVERTAGFGSAVAAGLATRSGAQDDADPDTVHWYWLLHDDSAPVPDTLVELLRTADLYRSAAVVGPKVRGWRNPDVLVQAGFTVARSGNRVTGLERHELDQGQHDSTTDVLAVGSAGMLVRRETWLELDGFDPALPLFRDDLDFCWRAQQAGHRVVLATSAVLHHREAATHGRRPVEAGSPRHPLRSHRLDRIAAIHLMRAHAHGWRRPWMTLRLLVGSLLRALGLLLGKAPDAARDEWGAFRDALRDRAALRSSRARVAASRSLPGSVPDHDVRALMAPRRQQVRHAVDRLGELVAARESADEARSVLDSTTDDPDGWYADDRRPSRLRRWFTRPGTVLALSLLLVALIGERALLGNGVLEGGALLPAPPGAADLWQSYLTAWHEVGPGSPADAPPWIAVLSALALVLRGSASSAVDLVLLGLVPMAGVSAYLATRSLLRTRWARVWTAATYATLPVATGALSGGRLGSAVSLVLLPWLAHSAARLAGLAPGRDGTRTPTWRRAAGTGLLLAVVSSFTPVVWIAAVVLAVVAAVTVRRSATGRFQLLLALVAPVVLTMPWSLRVVREPALLWLEPGLVGPVDPRLTPLDVLLARPGGPGSTPTWLGIGLVLAGLTALALRGRRRVSAAAWVVGLVGLTLGIVETVIRVQPPALPMAIAPWPGIPTALWAGALIVCAAVTAEQVPARLAGADFGWRQPAAVVVAALLLLAPAASIALLILGVDGPLHRGSREVMPAYVAAQMATSTRPRTLVMERTTGHRVRYDLLAAPQPQTGDPDVAAPAWVTAGLDQVVAQLAAGIGAHEVEDLADRGIGFLVVSDATGSRDVLVENLDGERGLRHLSSRSGGAVWQVVPVAARAQVLDPAGTPATGAVPVRRSSAVPVSPVDPRQVPTVAAPLTAGPPARRLLLAETLDDRWHWQVGSDPARAVSFTAADGALDLSVQQVAPGVAASSVHISYDGSARVSWLWFEALVLALLVLLALPSRRTAGDPDDDADADLAAPDVESPRGEPAAQPSPGAGAPGSGTPGARSPTAGGASSPSVVAATPDEGPGASAESREERAPLARREGTDVEDHEEVTR